MSESSDTFLQLVKDQFLYGGKKYAKDDKKEVTDELVDNYGFNWLLGTINKYVYRYQNLNREKDLLKIACYMFIMWLKFGYHLEDKGTANDNYTTVDIKSKFFSLFVDELASSSLNNEMINLINSHVTKHLALKEVSNLLLSLRFRANINRLIFIKIYKLVEQVWIMDGFNKIAVHDEDTWNESKKVKEHGKT
ncbi:MAG: hypothetical protein E2O29_02200 [Deltaproteobacteria bacterium]|nr:MAG: hypothetical protein E2O29_02200 [Deltaproteobacteria bacterium]